MKSQCSVWLLHSLPQGARALLWLGYRVRARGCEGTTHFYSTFTPLFIQLYFTFTPLLHEPYSTFTPPTRLLLLNFNSLISARGDQAMLASRIKVEGKHFKRKKSNRRYSLLCRLSSSFCGGLRQRQRLFFALQANPKQSKKSPPQKKNSIKTPITPKYGKKSKKKSIFFLQFRKSEVFQQNIFFFLKTIRFFFFFRKK